MLVEFIRIPVPFTSQDHNHDTCLVDGIGGDGLETFGIVLMKVNSLIIEWLIIRQLTTTITIAETSLIILLS